MKKKILPFLFLGLIWVFNPLQKNSNAIGPTDEFTTECPVDEIINDEGMEASGSGGNVQCLCWKNQAGSLKNKIEDSNGACKKSEAKCEDYNDCQDVMECTNGEFSNNLSYNCGVLNGCDDLVGSGNCHYQYLPGLNICSEDPNNGQDCPTILYYPPFTTVCLLKKNKVCLHQNLCNKLIQKYNSAAENYNSNCLNDPEFGGEIFEPIEPHDCQRNNQSLCMNPQAPNQGQPIVPSIKFNYSGNESNN